MSTIGARIKAARKAAGLTLDEVGAAVGRSKGHLSNVENDKDKPGLGLTLRLAVLFRAPLNELVEHDEELDHAEIAYGDEEVALVRAVRRMPEDQRRGLLALLKTGTNS